MRIIAFMNQKGGVGKTTTAANIAAGLAEMGARVLLIDLDSQTNLTTYFGLTPETETDIYDVMCEDADFNDAIQVVDENISLIAASKDLSGVDIELSDRADRVAVLRKKMAAANLRFDYVLMDCPPSLGLLTVNALAVAGEVIIPMQAHFLAMQGMAKLLETVQIVGKQVNPRLRIAGVVLTMFDANARLSTEVVAELERFFESARGKSAPWNEARLFKSRIRRNIKITESPSFGQSVLAYDSQCNGAKDYRELAREIASLSYTPSAIDNIGAPIPAAVSFVDRAIVDAEKQVDSVRLIDDPIETIEPVETT
ncbi:MAG TPA: ParA family protein, partial [Tepidisphaeraceae bacterium]|nr:ParA family protein [Tepidisphaeraceae bacterium]